MAHEIQGLRLVGRGWMQRLGAIEGPVLGPLPVSVAGIKAAADTKVINDPRSGFIGQALFSTSLPKAAEGTWTLLSCPPKLLAMALLGGEITVE
jgi:hypothetical protein